jgi:hypothetical protein
LILDCGENSSYFLGHKVEGEGEGESEFTDEKIIQSNHRTCYLLFVWLDIISEKEKSSM